MLNVHNSKGVTLIEAFLASFLFVIAASAIFASMVSIRRPAVNNEQEAGAALAGRQVMEDLRSKIDTRDMDNGGAYVSTDLTQGTHWVNNIGTGGIYNVEYTVTPDTTGGIQVNTTVYWPDAV